MNRLDSNESYLRICEYLSRAIEEGAFAPDGRLPTERQLAEEFAVSRAITRRALAKLAGEGLIYRHVGRGTFVKSYVDAQRESEMNAVSPAEYVEARLRFEPELAWLIVTNGTVADFERMDDCLKKSEGATTRDEFELWDAVFHQAIAASTHNKLAIRMYNLIHAARHEQAMWGTLRQRGQTPGEQLVFQREHREIFDALKGRDAERARDLMAQHIRNTRRRLLGY